MQIDHRAELAKIKTFPQLIAYLRDEMGWPIAQDSFEDVDDLFYDFTPDELGIDVKNAAKIQEIKRLRPLSPKQPWGIFFVKFEPKRLPVVALRRILSQVALKKRASANSAEMAAWAADDLLFVSNYGEGEERQISFAHFSKAQDGHDLPTLKVLGWDNLDTALHLDAVVRELTEHLAWPDDDTDVEAWRERWRAAFILRHREVITTSKDLSIRLAELARAIRDRTKTALAIEISTGPLTKLMKAFQEALVHDLDADSFADMYAQTIAYGLLSARITDPERKTVDDFAGHMRTNPFLRELMETFLKAGGRRGKTGGSGIDFDELGVSDVVDLLDHANMEAVVLDFGDRNPQEDPVIHFYELFLKEYDAKKRMQRGVFYTPRPVVSYIVRSVHELLSTEFGLEDGLADTTTWGEMTMRNKGMKIPDGVSPNQAFVQILDPACGTGTFLVEAIDLIHKTLVVQWKKLGYDGKKIVSLWNDYVPKHMLPRLHGYELLMAPYAIAHLKIGLKLYETGYKFESDQRARIYLTNALEPASPLANVRAAGIFEVLGHEAQAVNEIKRKQRFTVVIGNPPYSGQSANYGKWAKGLVRGYYEIDGAPLGERNPKWLQDDYVKFLAFGQLQITQTKHGILAFITNHGFIDNPTFRGMRKSLINSFTEIFNLNLHGNAKKKEVTPNGNKDENVFDIQQGVAICLMIKEPNITSHARIYYADLWGFREGKYEALSGTDVQTTQWTELAPAQPFYLFASRDEAQLDEYEKCWKVTDIFPVNSVGIVTSRDSFVLGFDDVELQSRISEFRGTSLTDDEIQEKYELKSNKGWNITDARKAIRLDSEYQQAFTDCLFRPFDVRPLFYHRAVIERSRPEVMSQMLSGDNLGLVSARSNKTSEMNHFFCSRNITELKCGEYSIGSYLFTLYLYPTQGEMQIEAGLRRPNLSPKFLNDFSEKLEMEFIEDGRGDLMETFGPDDIFSYAYAVFHSPTYRSRYAEFLKMDFPRLPLASNRELFKALTEKGAETVSLHLMGSPLLDSFITEYLATGSNIVDRVTYDENTQRVYINKTNYFEGLPPKVWDFHVGGYQVCEKWLKDRKRRTLSAEDITQYQKIVVAVSETIHLMKEIDMVIEKHGGWPAAFEQVQRTVWPDEIEVVEDNINIKKAIQTKGKSNKQEEAQVEIILKKERETPGTWRYKEENAERPMTIYLTKVQVSELGDPESIKVTIEAA